MNHSEYDDFLQSAFKTILTTYEEINSVVLDKEAQQLLSYGINNGILLAAFLRHQLSDSEHLQINMSLN